MEKPKRILAQERPDLLKEWDYEKNVLLCRPDEVTVGTKKVVWWICDKGHSYQMSVVKKAISNYKCPICSGRRVVPGVNDLATEHPELMNEWDYSKNENIVPQEITSHNNKKVWWKCSVCGNEWKTTVYSRAEGSLCPACANRNRIRLSRENHVQRGVNDFRTLYPKLMDEWDYEKNASICSPDAISAGSHTKVFWKCSHGHVYLREIRDKVKQPECPYCSGKKVLSGFNDFATTQPDLLKEWDYQKNTIDPRAIAEFSHTKAWWKCSKCGHEWKTSIGNRSFGSGCPKCARVKNTEKQMTAKLEDSVAFLFPELMREWDYNKNTLDPKTVYPGTQRKVWWICPDCGQHYYSSILNRTKGVGCPICAGKQIIQGINDFESWCKRNNKEYLLKEWDYEKNHVEPSSVAPFTSKRIWFICKEGHSFSAGLSRRTMGNTGCPICDKHNKTSFQEQACFYYLKKVFSSAVNSYHEKWLGQLELDIFIPEISTAIEYDGIAWHKDTKKDIRKNKLCSDNNVRLIRLREEGLEELEGCKNIIVNGKTSSGINRGIAELFEFLGFPNVDVDVDRDTPIIVEQFDTAQRSNSIASLYPELLKEWDYEKNGKIKPEYVSFGSVRKYWWKCSVCDHEWQMTPNARTNSGYGCPICALKKSSESMVKTLVSQRGSFEDTGSPLLLEWDYEKNSIRPSEITKASRKKVWWKCSKCGRSWQSTVQNRTLTGNGCPYCSGRKVIPGENDFASVHPELVCEWNVEKNGGLRPTEFTSGSGKKILWTCQKCGNEWLSSISDRSHHGCPYCTTKAVKQGFNDLATTNPNLLSEWDYEKNEEDGLRPTEVRAGSKVKAWWICPACGQHYQASIGNRVKGTGCPICSHKRGGMKNQRKVQCIETEIIFDSVSMASKWAKVSPGSLVNHLTGKSQSSGGYHWKYV